MIQCAATRLLALIVAFVLGLFAIAITPVNVQGMTLRAAQTALVHTAGVRQPATTPNATEAKPEAHGIVPIGSGSNALGVSLPNQVKERGEYADGILTYPTIHGSNNAVVANGEGTQILLVLQNAAASEDATYNIKLPPGGRLVLTHSDVSGVPAVLVLDASQKVVSTIDAPWATDATGRQVQTYYTVAGSNLTQHVSHRVQGTVYPVVADPYFHWYKNGVVITLSYDDEIKIATGGLVTLEALMGGSIWTLIGPLVAAGTLGTVVADASWSVATHQCAWLWAPYPIVRSLSLPDAGYYDC